MDKSSSFFEKNVEWIALALGGLFIAYIAYAFWYSSPVTIQLGSEDLTPAKVDPYIQEKAERPLAERMSERRDVAMPNVNVAEQYVRALERQQDSSALAHVPILSPRQTSVVQNLSPTTQPVGIAGLPKVPAVTEISLKSGRSFCAIAPPALPPVDPRDPVAPAPPPGRVVPQPQPVPVIVGGVQVNLAPGHKAEDAYWNTLFGKFDVNALEASFAESKIPPHLLTEPLYIAVELERVEVDPTTGKEIGTPVIVKPLPMNEIPIPRSEVDAYINYASQQNVQSIILQPPFHQVLAGSPWGLPGQELVIDPAAVVNQLNAVDQLLSQPFDAAQYAQAMKTFTEVQKGQVRSKLSAEQRGALYRAEKEEEAKDRASKAPPPGTTTKPPVRPRDRTTPYRPPAGNAPEDADALNRMFAQANPRDEQRMMRRPVPVRPGREEGIFTPPPAVGGQVILPGNIVPGADGKFDVWAHDGQAQPGKTYKYRMRVIIYNPLYNVQNVGNPAWAKIPYLPDDKTSGWSAWSEVVTIPTSIDMQFVEAPQSVGGKPTKAAFRIRRWQHGQENYSPKNFEVEPGDMIGGVAAAAPAAGVGAGGAGAPVPLVNPVGAGGAAAANSTVDYTTGWTLVDIRKVGDDFKARVVDPTGRMVTRSLKEDLARADFKPPAAGPPAGAPGLDPRRDPGIPLGRANIVPAN